MAAKKSASPSGYSGTALPKKLGIVEGVTVLLVGAPADFGATLGELPIGARVVRGGSGKTETVDVALLFVTKQSAMRDGFASVVPRMTPAGGIWIAWPKKASGVATDVTEDAIREDLLPSGWVDNKVCAIDATWSGLRMVLRKELRPKGK